MARGLFISFEGGEGCGKSTQIGLLTQWLNQHLPERGVISTREPGGTEQSEAIRDMLVRGAADKFTARTEALLMIAARTELVAQVIAPALARGDIVVSDRFRDSTSVYQGLAHEIPVASLDRLHDFAIDGLKPDITFLLDMPADEGLTRAMARMGTPADEKGKAAGGSDESRFEEKGLGFHQRVRDGFLTLAKAEPVRIHKIDATGTPEDIHCAITQILSRYLAQIGLVDGQVERDG